MFCKIATAINRNTVCHCFVILSDVINPLWRIWVVNVSIEVHCTTFVGFLSPKFLYIFTTPLPYIIMALLNKSLSYDVCHMNYGIFYKLFLVMLWNTICYMSVSDCNHCNVVAEYMSDFTICCTIVSYWIFIIFLSSVFFPGLLPSISL